MDIKTVEKVARLSRLKFTPAQQEKILPQLTNIIGFVEQLNEVDTDNVEPLANVVDIALPLRDDVVNDGGYPDQILANAPEQAEGFFVVPKVVE